MACYRYVIASADFCSSLFIEGSVKGRGLNRKKIIAIRAILFVILLLNLLNIIDWMMIIAAL